MSLVEELQRAREVLATAHHEYVTSVSSPGMALSLETSCLVWALCEQRKPKAIVDLGSGFSSYVIRKWARSANAATVSVDDDPSWLPRSKAFCAKHGLSTVDFQAWDEFSTHRMGQFDIVIYDLGRMPLRHANIARGLSFMAAGGIAVVDDMHKHNYHKEVVHVIAGLGMRGTDMKALTTDSHEGRHCWLVDRDIVPVQ